MSIHTLVTYATRFGSTERAAELIAETLEASGHAVDCRPMQSIEALAGYDAVVAGSAVNYGDWLPIAVAFVREHQATLSRIPVALFTVHCSNLSEDHVERREREAYLDGVRPYVSPASEGFFPGRFNRHAAVDLIPRWMARLMPTINLMKPDRIHAWAATLPALFQAQYKGVQDVSTNH